MIEDVVEEERTEDSDRYFRILRFSGFYYGFQRRLFSRVAFVFSTVFILASLCLLPSVLTHTLVNSKFSTKFASYPITCGCITQQTLNAIILYYCQWNGRFQTELTPLLKLYGAKVAIRRTKLLLIGIMLLALGLWAGFFKAREHNDEESVIFNYSDIFPDPVMTRIARFLSYYQVILVLIFQFYFNSSTGIVCSALNDFNVRFEKTLKQSAELRPAEETVTQLHKFYKEHLRLSKTIRSLDNLFNVYTFSVCATSIPTIVFSLWTLLVRAPFLHLLVTLAELCFSVVSLGIVCSNPIRMRHAIHETKLLLFSTLEIWQNYNPAINDITRLFISHLDEEHLGITAWGFVMITKSFILSIISLTTTFLIFIVESHSGHGNTSHVMHHATKIRH
ncbi:hypothetical protein M3Y97_00645700 [Aphelenchoides bicaudatus]|nr:hypothetical protein M3Y97_00645700 [Aphelenchoides bicaudatus]